MAAFQAKLSKERLTHPGASKDALHGLPEFFKIKMTAPQDLLTSRVDDIGKSLTIVAFGCRDNVYGLLQATASEDAGPPAAYRIRSDATITRA